MNLQVLKNIYSFLSNGHFTVNGQQSLALAEAIAAVVQEINKKEQEQQDEEKKAIAN